ncbi:hypothetical protein CAPTEDRAFT_205157 [Capitella teleta]|uniref:Mitochondrial transcription rescue factor 1 C-terminal domain-containing protein n=1 Tax=Capitella teleta TaxID=283909 RepID=R7U0X3_CAPTE|nr:hypothetical protein CAPTEDRAFT_205157 [Capitella teleta]|eukprot:ELT96825.1 hypothetical protein CAPTEDRAFT_205157 [Capitella teleta]
MPFMSDDEYDDLSDDENFFDEDADLPNNYRDLTVHVKSLRLDAILAQGLNVARNKVDEHFLGSNLELNGNRVLKKGKQLSEGDYIDVITSNDGEARRFKRVRITNVSSKTTKSDRKVVQLRVWRANITKDKN